MVAAVHKRIPHRELRNNSSAILRAVQSGATYEITNNGVVVAMLVPPQKSIPLPPPARAATVIGHWDEIPTTTSEISISQALDDLRAERP